MLTPPLFTPPLKMLSDLGFHKCWSLDSSQPQKTSHQRPIDDLDLFPGAVESANTDRLVNYLGGKYKVLPANGDQCLVLWKEHHKEFPTLASLAKDYLSCSANSASVELKMALWDPGTDCFFWPKQTPGTAPAQVSRVPAVLPAGTARLPELLPGNLVETNQVAKEGPYR
ncbi:hypothetical protein PGT21_005147 [Puccinia graminis f. sp. tritici]|uniref:HAT C-terminal dimerisation domain-containing protein n=1 Tax=Puccinia graminis f. sp. tritici TaxID=56615 RepID=A0A5B0N6M0_PUCGR|nr:hypothetical protein PGTUg99_035802 [Puccinia graminis f. sp. tritici]KAA1093977.1 hypothetical protein PGT21_005147 [Puccinia graminis f. sp. tritici]